jgi:ankyrin repeat protein
VEDFDGLPPLPLPCRSLAQESSVHDIYDSSRSSASASLPIQDETPRAEVPTLADTWSIYGNEFETTSVWGISAARGLREEALSVHPRNKKTSWFSPGGLGAPELEPLRVSNDDLQEAALRGDVGLVRRLIHCGASVNAPMQPESSDEFMTLLHLLASKPEMPNGTRIVNAVIRAAADVNARSSTGLTPLMLACRHKHIGASELLMSNATKIDPVDDSGKNAACYAVCRDLDIATSDSLSCELVNLLFVAKADLDDGGKMAPIVKAVCELNASAVQLLVSQKIGAQPLGLSEAVAVAPISLVRTLTNAEANPFTKDKSGKTPMDVALNRGDHEIMDLLRDFIADLQRRQHPHLQTPLQPGYDDIGILDTDDYIQCSQSVRGGRGSMRKTVPHQMLSSARLRTAKSVYDLSFREPETGWRQHWQRIRQSCRRMNKHNYFQIGMSVMLFWALFLVDFWILLDFDAGAFLDALLTIIFITFSFELISQIVGFGRGYLCSFYFWMDFFGSISVLLDMSVITDSSQWLSGGFGNSDGVVMRTARLAKLGARAGRFSKLVKILQFLPGLSPTQNSTGTARRITSALNEALSVQTSCLIILLAMLLPMFEIAAYPQDDHSMGVWLHTLSVSASEFPDTIPDLVSDFKAFYADLDFFPFTASCQFPNSTVIVYDLADSPGNSGSISEWMSEDKRIAVKFDLGFELRKEAWSRIGLTIFIAICLVSAALYMVNSVAAIALVPLENLFSKVHQTARKIFSSLISVAGPVNAQAMDVTSAASDDEDNPDNEDASASSEITVLEQVIKKIGKVSALMTKKDMISHEMIDALSKDYLDVLQCYGVFTLPHEKVDSAGAQYADNHSEGCIVEEIEEILAAADLKYDNLYEWEFNPCDLDVKKKCVICFCMLIFQRRSILSGVVSTDELNDNIRKFIEKCAAGHSSAKDVPFHNFDHAVDTAVFTFNIFKECKISRFMNADDRFALLVSAVVHDIGHRGLTNSFLIQIEDELAIRYNDMSPLENMQAAKLFELAAQPGQRIFAGFTRWRYAQVRLTCIEAILNTDFHSHFRLVRELQIAYDQNPVMFDTAEWDFATADVNWPGKDITDYFKTVDGQKLIKTSLLHFADISYNLKNWSQSCMWSNLMYEEFFIQGDKERSLGMPVGFLQDRESCNQPNAQIGFIEFFLGPMTLSLNNIFPPMDFCVKQLMTNAELWVEEWATKTEPPPDENEQAKKIERFVELVSKKHALQKDEPSPASASIVNDVLENVRRMSATNFFT